MNREPLSDWTVHNDVRSNQGSVETIGERVKLKKSNGCQKDNHNDEDMKRADWTPANNHAVTFNSAGSGKSHKERDKLRESTIGSGDERTGGVDDTKHADWTTANDHAVTFNSAGSSKSHNERDELRESTIGGGDDRTG
eukprot:scaffold191088_cov24-Attheya_sp.AAC.1